MKGVIKYNSNEKFEAAEYLREVSEIIIINIPIKKTIFLVFS